MNRPEDLKQTESSDELRQALSHDLPTPDAARRARIMEAVRTEADTSTPPATSVVWAPWVGLAAAFLVIAVLSVTLFQSSASDSPAGGVDSPVIIAEPVSTPGPSDATVPVPSLNITSDLRAQAVEIQGTGKSIARSAGGFWKSAVAMVPDANSASAPSS
jgi:hypothetical protein